METFKFTAEFAEDTITLTVKVSATGRHMEDVLDDAQELAEDAAALHFDCSADDEDLSVIHDG